MTFAARAFVPLLCLTAMLASPVTLPAQADDADWSAGFARTVITPDNPIFMSGYGNRDKPAEGKQSDLFARAAALRDAAGTTCVVVSLDLVGMSPEMGAAISQAVEKEHKIPRSQLAFATSHTHCGPALDQGLTYMLDMKEADWEKVRAYQKVLNQRVIDTVGAALKDMKPATLAFGHGRCGFAINRRPPIGVGPIDHDVPVLRISGKDGKVRGVIFGYACHATVMSFFKWFGDYPGMAAQYLEDRHPGAVALFTAGCGADQNPLPRRKIELAEKYGRLLAVAVDEAMEKPMTPVAGSLKAAYTTTDLAFERIPPKEEIETWLKSTSRFERARGEYLLRELKSKNSLAPTYAYPVQVWKVGNAFTWVTLGGEVVVDYALRLKKELGAETTWVTGYANDVMAYIPSERVLKEGGYEGASSMIVYQQPSSWKTGLEDQIVKTVHALKNGMAK
ncbi:MAG: neutral/alkaline non-lysosomal ceramidase N-terminal domain-containing protein [Planctomycetaceae bacterium]|nr:neutral/alkaline non-lysosomal ceramidase N-terminal domain-containing protein [Planctomycetaceae bacterium]